jgi:hypothetical protein
MSRTPISSRRPRRGGTFRPQLEALDDRLAPGGLPGAPEPPPELAYLAWLQAAQQQAATQTTSPVVEFSNRDVVRGESTLIRTDNGVTAHLTASGLAPGVYTFWMRVDAPGVGPVAGRLAGHVVGESGILNVSAHVSVGEVLSGHPVLPSGPLQDPLHATITLVVRKHGPADPGRIYEQTHTFEPDRAFNFLISIHTPPP